MNIASYKKIIETPLREYILSILVLSAIVLKYTFKDSVYLNTVDIYAWIIAIIGSIPLVIFSVKEIFKLKITIEVFNLFALTIAILLNNNFAALWIELMLIFASYLEWKTKSRAKNAVEELLKLAPSVAHRQTVDDQYEDINPSELKIGDIILIKTGEKIPADGNIIFGDGVLDESSFTGESMPQEKNIGDKVLTATILNSGVIKIKATEIGEDTVLSKMVILMREALLLKSKFHKFADIFASIFLPVVTVVAIVIYFSTHDLDIVAAFLVIICADDIAVAIPLAMEAAFGRAAKRGVIVKGGIYFEKLANAKIVIFDKTGTLTSSTFKVDLVEIAAGFESLDFWKYIGIAEKLSEHPIGKAIYKESQKMVKTIDDPDDVLVISGAGIMAKNNSNEIIVGNIKAMVDYKIEVVLSDNYISKQKGKTVLYVAVDKKHIGTIYLSDSVKDNAYEAIKELKKLKIKTIMLSGDKKDVADTIGNKLGIDEIYSELDPEEKLNIVTELSKKKCVVMVGDGVNDAPALARADVGIAMGKIGMAASIEAADVVIQTDNLMRISELIVLAKQVKRVVVNNFIIWFVTNAIGTTLVLTKTIGIPFAAFYNFSSDFIPLINSFSLFKNQK